MNLVNTSDISNLLGLSVRHVREKVVTAPHFPRPAVQISIKTRRWDMADVQRWLEAQRKKCAR